MADREDYHYQNRRPKRRIRMTQGAVWMPHYIPDVEFRDKGKICRTCHRRIPYKDLDVKYETRSGDIFRVWFCSYCDNMLAEENMSEIALERGWEGDE